MQDRGHLGEEASWVSGDVSSVVTPGLCIHYDPGMGTGWYKVQRAPSFYCADGRKQRYPVRWVANWLCLPCAWSPSQQAVTLTDRPQRVGWEQLGWIPDGSPSPLIPPFFLHRFGYNPFPYGHPQDNLDDQ